MIVEKSLTSAQRDDLRVDAADLGLGADRVDLELRVLALVDHDRAGLGQPRGIAGDHVPRREHRGLTRHVIDADDLDAEVTARAELELGEVDEDALGALHAGDRCDLVVRALVERRRELERLVAGLADPQVRRARVDQRARGVHEAEVQADLDEHEHHRHRHAGDRDREAQAVVKEKLASQRPHEAL